MDVPHLFFEKNENESVRNKSATRSVQEIVLLFNNTLIVQLMIKIER